MDHSVYTDHIESNKMERNGAFYLKIALLNGRKYNEKAPNYIVLELE